MIKTRKGGMGKRGSIDDAMYISLFLVFFAIFAYPMFTAFSQLNTAVQGNAEIDSRALENQDDLTNRIPTIFEGIYLILFFFSYFGAFILSSFIDSKPAFFVIAVIIFGVMAFVIPLLANSWDAVTNGQFPLAESQFVIIPYIMQNYLQLNMAMWALLLVGIYAKRSLSN